MSNFTNLGLRAINARFSSITDAPNLLKLKQSACYLEKPNSSLIIPNFSKSWIASRSLAMTGFTLAEVLITLVVIGIISANGNVNLWTNDYAGLSYDNKGSVNGYSWGVEANKEMTISVKGATIKGKNVDIDNASKKGNSDVSITGSTVEATTGDIFIGSNKTINSSKNTLTAAKGGVYLYADSNITETSDKVTAGETISVSSDNGSITSAHNSRSAQDIYLTAKYDVNMSGTNVVLGKQHNIEAGRNVNVTASNNLTSNNATIKAGNNVNINSVRQLTAKNNNITAEKGGVNVSNQLDAVTFNNNTVTAKTDVNVTSATNSLNAAGNTIKSTNGSVNLTADKNGAGGFDSIFALNAQNNTITAGKDVNLDAGKAANLTVKGNTVNANGAINVTAKQGTILSSNNTYSAKNGTNLKTGKGSITYNNRNEKTSASGGGITQSNDQIKKK